MQMNRQRQIEGIALMRAQPEAVPKHYLRGEQGSQAELSKLWQVLICLTET